MTLFNVVPREEAKGFARTQSTPYQFQTVKPQLVEELVAKGWEVKRKSKKSVRLQKPKTAGDRLEGRVWTLMYRMGFKQMSGKGGAKLAITPDEESPESQIDCVAIDDEVAIAIECKSFENPRRDANFEEKMAKFSIKRKPLQSGVGKVEPEGKRHTGLVIFTSNVLLGDNDQKRAEEQGVHLFDDRDLEFYEKLTQHLGEAARFQFLAEVFHGKQIDGLEIKVPALKARMGKHRAYTFSVRPDYLLKIAYVSRRAQGKAAQIDAYQRMVQKGRLKKIREYISKDGAFPTNIVLNIEKQKYARFDLGKDAGDDEGGRFGWLTLSPTYGCAWIIDGQHRLFAYANHAMSSKASLSVLAFEGLTSGEQARFFIDINHEQKSVKQNLLDELWAELHWDADDKEMQVRAVASKTIQDLNLDRTSPLHDRILLADSKKTATRCISLTSLVDAITRGGGLFFSRPRGMLTPGPLYAEPNMAMLKRAKKALNGWLGEIANQADDWWQLGSAEGGGLAMNDATTASLNVMKTVYDHLTGTGHDLAKLSDDELAEIARPYAKAVGNYFAKFSPQEREDLRKNRGVQGQTNITRLIQVAVKNAYPKFDPPGLADWIEEHASGSNEEGRKLIDWIERTLQAEVLRVLKMNYGSSESDWWFKGVPAPVRKKVDDRINEADGQLGGREQNFDLIDYRRIIENNWRLFEYLGVGEGAKEKRTSWLQEVNRFRLSAMHASRGETLTRANLRRLQEYEGALKGAMSRAPQEPVVA